MSQPEDSDPHAGTRSRLESEIRAAVDAVHSEPDTETALRLSSWITEALRQAMITSGEVRATLAVRLRAARDLSFTDLGKIMSVSRIRAAEIVDKARKRDASAPLPVIALSVITGPRGVLVSKRTDRTPPWSFIGGEVRDGEDVAEAAVREVREETDAEVVASEVIGRREHPGTGRVVSYVACRLADAEAEVTVADTDELVEVRWVDVGDADLLLPGMFAPVRDYLARTLRT